MVMFCFLDIVMDSNGSHVDYHYYSLVRRNSCWFGRLLYFPGESNDVVLVVVGGGEGGGDGDGLL